MGKKNDMKSKRERYQNQKRERKRVVEVQEAKGSNAMLIWLGLAFLIVIGLVAYLVWQTLQEDKLTNPDPVEQSESTERTDEAAKPTTNAEAQDKQVKERKKLPISNKPNPVKKMVKGLPKYDFAPPLKIDTSKDYKALLKTNKGDIEMELYASDAPKAVNNFIFLAEDNYYDGVTFHGIQPNYKITTGDPEGTGKGGPGYVFEDEFSFAHDYDPGYVMMERVEPNKNGSQFSIITGTGAEYMKETRDKTIFGKVTKGMDLVQQIASAPPKKEDIIIKDVEIIRP